MNEHPATHKNPSFAALVDDYPPPTRQHEDTPRRPMAVSLETSSDRSSAPDFFVRPGVRRRHMKVLRQQYSWPHQDQIDLHGLSRDVARQRLEAFLGDALTRHCDKVQIIHGKGLHSHAQHGVLRQQVRSWLQQSPLVLGWCTPPPAVGGAGCTRVLLKVSG